MLDQILYVVWCVYKTIVCLFVSIISHLSLLIVHFAVYVFLYAPFFMLHSLIVAFFFAQSTSDYVVVYVLNVGPHSIVLCQVDLKGFKLNRLKDIL